jgi:hypothetical protein
VQIRSKSDPIGFVRISEQKYTFLIGLIKLFRSRIGLRYSKWNELIVHALLQQLIIHAFIKALSRLLLHFSFDTSIGRHFVIFLTCISCFYIYLVKHFNLNERFILLKDSSDRIEILYHNSDRIGFGLDNFGTDRILNIGQLSDYKRPIRSDARLAPSLSFIVISIHYSVHYMT